MKPTAWLTITGCLAGMTLISCREKSPSDLPQAPVAQVTSPPVAPVEPEPVAEETDLTPPPAEPPAPMPDEEEPSAPDGETAPD
ncbi:MAG TPA: hypothetical protein VIM57_04265 [Luteolibacter sp.]